MLIDTDEFGALADMLSAQKIKALEERIAAQERRLLPRMSGLRRLRGNSIRRKRMLNIGGKAVKGRRR